MHARLRLAGKARQSPEKEAGCGSAFLLGHEPTWTRREDSFAVIGAV
jgi:hypothetical protein